METELKSKRCSREVEYPANCSSAKAKKKHKEATLLSNTEQLFADYIFCNSKKIKKIMSSFIQMTLINGRRPSVTVTHTLPKKALVAEAA